MEVKPGYKQTEVGVIPEEWEVKRLKSVAELTSSKRIFESDYVPNGIPFYRGKEISQLVEGQTVDDACFISESRFTSIKTRFGAPVRGDVLVTSVGTLANVYVVDTDEPFYFKDGNLIWLRNIQGVDANFLGIQLRRSKRAILDGAIGTSQKALTIVVLRELSVAIPPSPEQRAIAEALSDVDGLLGGLDRLIAKKRDLKQAAMQQLLTGQTRLPGFHGEWELSTVGSEFEIKLGKMLDAEKNVGVPKPFIGNKAVQWDRIDISDLATVPMSRSDIERFRLRKGDLLVCEGGEVGRAAIWDAPIEECYYQKALHRLRPLRGFNSQFMAALLRLWSDRGEFSNYVTQTSIAHLPREKFTEMPLPVPSAAEQTAIAEVLTEMDAELAALEQRREKTRALKQAMMQELLTGKTRLL